MDAPLFVSSKKDNVGATIGRPCIHYLTLK